MKQKNILSSSIMGVALMGVVAGCNHKNNNQNISNNSNQNGAPEIHQIPVQEVDEGSSFELDLGQYISDPNGDSVVITKKSGVGVILNNRFSYQDSRDSDNLNDNHRIEFEASDGKGISSGSLDINQRDNFYRIAPGFLVAKLWVAYSPTNFNPITSQYPNEASLRSDLEKLVGINTHGIVTYGSENILGQIPRIAKEVGIQKVLMGIWDPLSSEEINNAMGAQQHVDGYCIGNEGLNVRYTLPNLESAIDSLRNQTDKPVTTTERLNDYYNSQELLDVGDWVFPNAHPFWSGIIDPSLAVDWTVNQLNDISSRTTRTVVFKEVGLPTEGGAGLSQQNQNEYYRKLETRLMNPLASHTRIVHFEAFDQPWKNSFPVEPHWGFFTSDRTPKMVASPQVVHTFVPSYGTFNDLRGRVVNVTPQDYRISTYINVNGVWWMKPTFANPLTPIDSSRNWITDITTGGIDQFATSINSYLVSPSYVPQHTVLPVVNGQNVIHGVSSQR